MTLKLSTLIILMLFAGFHNAAQLKRVDAIKTESSMTYFLTHPMHEIEAVSKEVESSIEMDMTSRSITGVSVRIDVTSFNSGNSNRDSHAMEVIDALTYPEVQFNSTHIQQKGDSVNATGELTFHGITHEVDVRGVMMWSEQKLVITGGFEISLTAFKIDRPSLLFIPANDTLRFSFKQVYPLQN
jgi:polyisoprenoid-binding protein YceI